VLEHGFQLWSERFRFRDQLRRLIRIVNEVVVHDLFFFWAEAGEKKLNKSQKSLKNLKGIKKILKRKS
jgi:hypothetical protein